MQGYNFNYHYGDEANQYSFYRIPKVLFTDEIFKGLSCEAKVLYGLMLDRMGLSMKNNWVDENNRVFIYFTLEDVRETMCCGQDKGVKLLAELDDEKGIGLIERKKQGMGRPTKIYVKSFITTGENKPSMSEKTPQNQDIGKTEVKTSEKPKSLLLENRSQDIGKTEVMKSENPKSRLPENRSHEVGKTDPNNTDINNTEFSENDFNDTDINDIEYQSIHQSINHINPSAGNKQPETKQPQPTDAYEIYRQLIKDNIDYDCLCFDKYRKEDVDEIVELMLEAVCSTKKRLRINSEDTPAAVVKSRLLKLDYSHIEYVLDTLKTNTTKVHNIRNYLLTTLYNSYTSISHYYQAEVNHDMYGS